MAFVTLSDASGVYEVTLFSELLPMARPLLEVGTALVMAVEIQKRGDELRLTVTSLEPLDQAITRTAARFQVYVDGPQAVAPLHALLGREGPGRNKITLLVQIEPTREVEIDLPGAWALSGKARGAFKSLPGIVAVEEI
jgi:DNA polymerase-3 subunit alpha